MPSVAPSCLARSSLALLLEVAMTRAPAKRENCKPNSETPPVPRISTVSPGFIPPSVISACQAVTPAQGSVAASSSVRCSGTWTTPSSCSTTYSASIPSAWAPRLVRALSSLISPLSHFCMKMPATPSPIFTRLTPAPTATTLPTPSERGTKGKRCLGL